MPEQKMTYQERLKYIAQKHADKWNNLVGPPVLGYTDAGCVENAKRIISAQAEAIHEFARICFVAMPDKVDIWLQDQGYIEPKTEEDASPSN